MDKRIINALGLDDKNEIDEVEKDETKEVISNEQETIIGESNAKNKVQNKATYNYQNFTLKDHKIYALISKTILFILLFLLILGSVLFAFDDQWIIALLGLIGGIYLFIIAYGIVCIVENTENK